MGGRVLLRIQLLIIYNELYITFVFAFQFSQHQDPVIGDCDGVQGPCPFSQIGCSKTEVYVLFVLINIK